MWSPSRRKGTEASWSPSRVNFGLWNKVAFKQMKKVALIKESVGLFPKLSKLGSFSLTSPYRRPLSVLVCVTRWLLDKALVSLHDEG